MKNLTQETLEQAAEIWFKEIGRDASFMKAIEFGANYQAERMYTLQDLEKAYDLGVQAMNERGVYSRAMCDWDEVKQQFKKK
jgi:hypothetical protein